MPPVEQSSASDHLTLSRWIAGILLRRRLLIAVAAGTVLLALAATLIIPPVYRSEASFVANSSGGARVPASVSGSNGLGGILSQLGGGIGGDPSESPNFYIQLLASRELLTRLLQSPFANPRTEQPGDSARLVDIFRIRQKDPARRLEIGIRRLQETMRTGFDVKTNLVTLSVDTEYPRLSADVGNRVIELVNSFNRETRVSRARAKREFLQDRTDSAGIQLRQAEERQRFFYEQNRLWRTSPSLTFDEQRIRREVDVASDLYLTLQRQLEVARLEEFNDAALITVIDSAVPARKAQWPRYGVVLLTSSILGVLIGFMVAGSAAVMTDWRDRNPEAWSDLRSAIWRSKALRGAPSQRPGEVRPVVVDAQTARLDEPIPRVQRPVA